MGFAGGRLIETSRGLSVKWLPRPPEDSRVLPPVRQWLVGFERVTRDTRLEFVAVEEDGAGRLIGAVEGRPSVAVQLITEAGESLRILSNQDTNAMPNVVAQRWVMPYASLRLEEMPLAIAAVGGQLGLRSGDGSLSLVNVAGPAKRVRRPAVATDEVVSLNSALDRQQRRGRNIWNSTAQISADTIAVIHKGALLIGRVGELQTL